MNSLRPETPNHALQRTGVHVTARAARHLRPLPARLIQLTPCCRRDSVTTADWRGQNRALLSVTIRDKSLGIRDTRRNVTAGGGKCHGNVTARNMHERPVIIELSRCHA